MKMFSNVQKKILKILFLCIFLYLTKKIPLLFIKILFQVLDFLLLIYVEWLRIY